VSASAMDCRRGPGRQRCPGPHLLEELHLAAFGPVFKPEGAALQEKRTLRVGLPAE